MRFMNVRYINVLLTYLLTYLNSAEFYFWCCVNEKYNEDSKIQENF